MNCRSSVSSAKRSMPSCVSCNQSETPTSRPIHDWSVVLSTGIFATDMCTLPLSGDDDFAERQAAGQDLQGPRGLLQRKGRGHMGSHLAGQEHLQQFAVVLGGCAWL